MLDLQRLRVLRAVVAAGSVQAAATNLGYTPSAISQQLTALQKETGLALYTRVGRGIEPTTAGMELASMAESVIGQLSQVEARVKDLRDGHSGTLSIGYFSSVGIAWMPQVIAALTETFPNLRLQLFLEEADPTGNRRLDLQLRVGPGDGDPAQPSPTNHPLLIEPYLAAMHRDHPLANQSQVELSQLAHTRMIDNDVNHGWCAQTVLTACAAAGFAPNYAVQAQDHQTALAFVRAGLGVTVLPRLCTLTLPPEVVTRPLVNPTPMRSISLQVHDSMIHAPTTRVALEALRACAETKAFATV